MATTTIFGNCGKVGLVQNPFIFRDV